MGFDLYEVLEPIAISLIVLVATFSWSALGVLDPLARPEIPGEEGMTEVTTLTTVFPGPQHNFVMWVLGHYCEMYISSEYF